MNHQLYQWRGSPATWSWRDRAVATAERAGRNAHDRRWIQQRRSMRRVSLRLALLFVIALLCTMSGTAVVFDTRATVVQGPQPVPFLSLERGITAFSME